MFLETRPLETFHYPALGSSNRVSPVLSVRARAPASGYLAPSPFPHSTLISQHTLTFPCFALFSTNPKPDQSNPTPFRLSSFHRSSTNLPPLSFVAIRRLYKNCKNSVDMYVRESLIGEEEGSSRKFFQRASNSKRL